MLDLSKLTAINPIDGRYGDQTSELRGICSEFGLMQRRLKVELAWFKALSECENVSELPPFSKKTQQALDQIEALFSYSDAESIKSIERKINHDVKAIEYFLKSKLENIDELRPFTEFLHFSCTSEDINNLAYALMLKDMAKKVIIPRMEDIISLLTSSASAYAEKAMISRTHGQPASPTTMGKELANYIARLSGQLDSLKKVKYLGKFNGAVGNYNALSFAYPEADWIKVSGDLVRGLGLSWNEYSTQIEPHDYLAEFFDNLSRFNNVLLDLSKNLWSYISVGYFSQKITEDEVGSSTMPHKVNPIDFENAEGNLGLSNAISYHLANKLPNSRFQRDLSDSTVLRNIGLPLAYSLIAYNSMIKGLPKLELNENALQQDLKNNWELLAEPIQTAMRKYGVPEPYEKLKHLTRGKTLDETTIKEIIRELNLPSELERRLLALRPESYTGQASKLVERLIKK